MSTNIADRIVVVTGAGSGIGRATALGFCRDGARVIGFGRNQATLAETASLCGGDRMSYVAGDVSSEQDVDRLVKEMTQRHGRIDILINNAAVYPRRAFLEEPIDEWAETISINVIGPALCCQRVLPGMLERRFGRIINIGSFAGVAPARGSSAYSVSKAALMSLTRAVSVEVDRGLYPDVLVNELVPPHVRTQMNPQGDREPDFAYPQVRFLVDIPAGGPTGQVFQNNRIVQTDFGVKARLRRWLADTRARLAGEPRY